MTWNPIPDSAKSLLEGVEFGMTDGATTCQCLISQYEIDKWANHVGKIDRHKAFELFREHESEIYTAAAGILGETPFAKMTITAEDHRFGTSCEPRWPCGANLKKTRKWQKTRAIERRGWDYHFRAESKAWGR